MMGETPFVIKMTNGDDVIGIRVAINEDHILIENCMHLILDTDGDKERLYLSPYAPYALNNIVPIQSAHIISLIPVNELMAEYYSKTVAYNNKFLKVSYESGVRSAIDFLDDHTMEMNFSKEDIKDRILASILQDMPVRDKGH